MSSLLLRNLLLVGTALRFSLAPALLQVQALAGDNAELTAEEQRVLAGLEMPQEPGSSAVAPLITRHFGTLDHRLARPV